MDRSEVVEVEAHSADEGEELTITHTIRHTLYATSTVVDLMYKLYCYIIHCLQLLSYI